MDIEFFPTFGQNFDLIQELKYFLENLIDKEKLNLVSKCLIVRDDYYKYQVNKVDKNATVSDNTTTIGIAKTIYICEKNTSVIIIRKSHIEPLFYGIKSKKPYQYWLNEQLSPLYTFIHEMGHVIDYSLRPSIELQKLEKPYKFEKVCYYYYKIILDEIAANICATQILPIEVKLRIQKHLIDQVYVFNQHLKRFGIKNNNGILDEYDCFDIIGLISVVVLKFKEGYIHRINNYEDIIQVFSDKDSTLIKKMILKIENTYPYINYEDLEVNFYEIIENILNSYGFKKIKIDNTERIARITYY